MIWVSAEPPYDDMEGPSKIKPHQKRGPIVVEILVNALPLAVILYGFKCVVTQGGQLMEPSKYMMRSFFLRAVEGRAAVLAGLAYVALGAFVYLSANPPRATHSRFWRFVRSIVRWGSLVAMIWLLDKARTV